MKPYILVASNYMKLSFLRCLGYDISFHRICMISAKSKISMTKTSHIYLGRHIVSDGRTVIMVGHDARLSIGDSVYFNEDMMISCKRSVTIGPGTKFGPGVKVFDNNHKFDAVNGVSEDHSMEGISIGSGCWIGANVIILKGTSIGKNCVIGAGSVVSGVIPDQSIVTMDRHLIIQPMEKL